MKINAFLACRLGSKRVPFKNLILLNRKPLFSFLTDNALSSKKINNLYLNTDSEIIINIGKKLYGSKLNYYLRPSHLGTSSVSLDEYAYDFMIKFPSFIPFSIFTVTG